MPHTISLVLQTQSGHLTSFPLTSSCEMCPCPTPLCRRFGHRVTDCASATPAASSLVFACMQASIALWLRRIWHMRATRRQAPDALGRRVAAPQLLDRAHILGVWRWPNDRAATGPHQYCVNGRNRSACLGLVASLCARLLPARIIYQRTCCFSNTQVAKQSRAVCVHGCLTLRQLALASATHLGPRLA